MQHSAVEGPAGAVLASQQVVGLGAVGHAAGGAVVVELLADAVGDQAQQQLLDHVAAVLEVAGRLEAGVLAGVDPLLLEVAQGRQHLVLRARLVVGQVGVVAEGQHDARAEVGDDETLRALEHRAVVDLLQVDVGLRRAGHRAALVPAHADRAAPVVGRVLEVRLARRPA